MKQIFSKRKYLAIAIIIVIGLAIPIAFADDIADAFVPPTIKVVYDGATPIKDAIDTKIASAVSVKEGKTVTKEELTKEQIEASGVDTVPDLGLAAKTEMEKLTYPYELQKPEDAGKAVTVVTIQKCRFDEPTQTMWYWVSATRDGQEVAVNNPVWIYPAPKDTTISEVLDDKTNIMTITRKEDPKLAVEEILRDYVDRQPLGKSNVGTKE